ncbi:MAG: hypothetical protein R3C03_18070 [Pirellulaceae bacterium]
MRLSQIFAGLAAGLMGAAIWAAIAYFANVEIGYVAVGIGFLVGFVIAQTGPNGTGPAIGAVLITVLAFGGRQVGND